MKKLVTVPILAGLDSGADGFMRGRTENDGCVDDFARRRVEQNLGHSMGGGFFVPGLCPADKPFAAEAVCYSRQEVIDKARKLGVGVRGPGINVEPQRSDAEIKAREEADDGVPSIQAMKHTISEEIRQNHGGKVTRKEYRKIAERLQARHSRTKYPTTKKIESIYEPGK
jgi:hypothetical protein